MGKKWFLHLVWFSTCLVVDLADSHWERHPPQHRVQWLFGHPARFVTHQKGYTSAKRYRNGWQSPFWPTPCITLNEKITHWTSWKPSCIIGEYFKFWNCSGRLEILMTPLNILSKKWISFWNGRCGKQIILNFKKEPSRQARLCMLHQSIPYCLGLWLQALDLLKWAGIKTLINAQVRRKDLPSPAETNCYKVIQMRRVSTYSNYHSWRKQVSNQDDITLHMNMLP